MLNYQRVVVQLVYFGCGMLIFGIFGTHFVRMLRWIVHQNRESWSCGSEDGFMADLFIGFEEGLYLNATRAFPFLMNTHPESARNPGRVLDLFICGHTGGYMWLCRVGGSRAF